MSLFRIVELTSGSITIDGVNIASISVATLRQRMSIIPQDAMLFAGTIRSNLDPTNTHDDFQVWQALEQVNMRDYVQKLEARLEALVDDNGKNLSLGQRQLLYVLLLAG
jgi:ABC-type multidrug transport system fused ATPase/permease subunit